MTRGGIRKGAGRPPKANARHKRIWATVSPSELSVIREWAEAQKLNVSDYVRGCLGLPVEVKK